jgi:hypothetical protein
MATGQLSVLSVSSLTYSTDQQLAPRSASEKMGPKKTIFMFSINQERKVLSGFATVNVRSLNLINYVDVLYKTSAVFRYPQATSGLVTQSSNTFVHFSHKPVFTFSNPRNFGG